jgi:hypothetical protein
MCVFREEEGGRGVEKQVLAHADMHMCMYAYIWMDASQSNSSFVKITEYKALGTC